MFGSDTNKNGIYKEADSRLNPGNASYQSI
jgi:hypothetical protein